ncbi:Polynucleotidyl transferase- ribonuclease H-like superfamily protein [Striga hermonthica]|uniref:Polynucleotidyl transferase- ribonuclease H-like superfamily protein n=1 Tax=Striga hermonthica TaxID=68872 RepID=A0A9N7R7W5_STRHE|nr:Polynucleotidyl transferase- ribonuclease H-like superfamily protein [Striga hermonthica]
MAAGHRETVLHVVRDCPFVKSLWQRFLPAGHGADLLFEQPLRQGFIRNLTHARLGSYTNWASLFSIVVWKAWAWQNDRIFNGRTVGCETRRVEVLNRLQSYIHSSRSFDKMGAEMDRFESR